MVLGSLLQLAQNARIWPQPEFPYEGVSVDGLKKDILAVEIRTLCDITDPESGLKTHKGELAFQHNPTSPFRGQIRVNSNSLSRNNIFAPLPQQNQQASQAINESITSKINSVCDRLCGLSIEEFR
jgi:hypothetical protein